MHFLLADTFTAALNRLTAQEQRAVKTTAFDLQLDPAAPRLSVHRIERAKDPNFWSMRVSADIRIIVHKTTASLLLCYVGHHDDAYAWAERRRIEVHPTTGAAQLVVVPERAEREVRYIPAPPLVLAAEQEEPSRYLPPLFLTLAETDLLAVGVPPDWVEAVHNATEDNIFILADNLPYEAVEALLDYVSSGVLRPVAKAADGADPFDHPDALRRFRQVGDIGELERALDYPWEKWTVFLHPDQRQLVEKDYAGPVRISGSAGTGKTIVALHRAAALARRDRQARVLLTTFSSALARALALKLGRLVGNEPDVAARITVRCLSDLAVDLHTAAFGAPLIASIGDVRAALVATGPGMSPNFLLGEWTDVVDAWQLQSWEEYRDVARLGRKTRIGGKQREVLWGAFAAAREMLAGRGLTTWAELFDRLARSATRPFDFVVVDEAQDIGVAEMRFLAALAAGRRNGLCFTGDLGQRIFQQPFSWKSLGVDVRGRSHTLRVNYRTSHQIRERADHLLPAAISDVDGNEESRKRTVALFNGPPPDIRTFADADEEAQAVGGWILDLMEDGVAPEEIGLFVRSDAQLPRLRAAAAAFAMPATELGESLEAAPGHVSLSTMHLAKGLEFRAVAVMACDDEVIQSQERIEAVADAADLDEVYNTERHLLYVACTRARDHLLVTGVEPVSEFLDDLRG